MWLPRALPTGVLMETCAPYDKLGIRPAEHTLEADPHPLAQSLALFEHLDAAGVPYCHFKSNEHLLEGLAGLTDLDLLVGRREARVAQAALERAGFKRFPSRFASAYPSVEDYLGFDAETGRLVHAHVHYALVAGEKHLKSYQLGFAGDLLATRVADPATGVYTSDSSYEMLLLLLRYSLKARLRDALAEPLGRPCFGQDARREHAWLRQRLRPGILHQITEQQLGKAAGEVVESLAERPPSVWKLFAFRRRAARALARHRSYGFLERHGLRGLRELTASLGALNRRLLGLPIPLRRTLPAGGLIVAFLGPDGSGKSTLVADVRRWAGWKLDVYAVYFGSGDGPASLLRWPLVLAIRLLRGVRGTRRGPGAGSAPGEAAKRRGRISPVRALWALVLAQEKRSKMRSAVRARNRGMVVICDRYPQAQIMGFNDGPLLSAWMESGSRLKRRLARWEFETYRELARTAPDLVVKMDVPPEVAVRRKPDMRPDEVERRRAAVRQIDYGPASETLSVDGTRPLAEVQLRVRRALWELL